MFRYFFFLLKIVFLSSLIVALALPALPVNGRCKRRVCYYESTSMYRSTPWTRFTSANIDTRLCSHIIYMNTVLNYEGISPTTLNETLFGNYEKVTGLKNGTTYQKVLLALQISPYDFTAFSNMAESVRTRSEFAAKVIQFLRKYHFDGLDFNIFIFGPRKAPHGIRYKITQVLEQLRHAFDRENSTSGKLLLTVAVYGKKIFDDETFDIFEVSKNVDWINFLAYDFNPPWHVVIDHNSPLYPDHDKGDNSAMWNVKSAVKHWIDRGAPKDKIVLGIPFYGRPYIMSSWATGIGAPTHFSSSENMIIWSPIQYYEICQLIIKNHTVPHYMSKRGATYLVSGNNWISYDGVESLKQKVQYVRSQGLGGFAAYSIDCDDFTGHFCNSAPFPLLRAANMACIS